MIFACHADQVLRILEDMTELERDTLGHFPYQANRAILHVDQALLPRQQRAWAGWNYHIPAAADQPVAVTYDLNRLQRLGSPRPICLTLNHQAPIDPVAISYRLWTTSTLCSAPERSVHSSRTHALMASIGPTTVELIGDMDSTKMVFAVRLPYVAISARRLIHAKLSLPGIRPTSALPPDNPSVYLPTGVLVPGSGRAAAVGPAIAVVV